MNWVLEFMYDMSLEFMLVRKFAQLMRCSGYQEMRRLQAANEVQLDNVLGKDLVGRLVSVKVTSTMSVHLK
jgi:hypothetical protein